MPSYFYWEPTGAKFYVPRGCEWGKELERDGWLWVEEGE